MVSFLFAGIPPLRRHRHEDRDARVADPGAVKGGQLAAFKSEWWPASARNGGRLHVGKHGRIESESAVHNARRRGKALLGVLVAALVA